MYKNYHEEEDTDNFRGAQSSLTFKRIKSNQIRVENFDDICIFCHELCSLKRITKFFLVTGQLKKQNKNSYIKGEKECGICSFCYIKYESKLKKYNNMHQTIYYYIHFATEGKFFRIHNISKILSYTDYMQDKIFKKVNKINENEYLKLITPNLNLNELCCTYEYYDQMFISGYTVNMFMMTCNMGLENLAKKIMNIGYSKEYFKKHGKYLNISTIGPDNTTALTEACRTDMTPIIIKILDRKPKYLRLFFKVVHRKREYKLLKYYYLKELKN